MKIGGHTPAVVLTLLLLPCASYAQVPQVTPDQARQALLPCVHAPAAHLPASTRRPLAAPGNGKVGR